MCTSATSGSSSAADVERSLHIIEQLRFPVPRAGPVTVSAYPFMFRMYSRREDSSPPPATL